MRSPDGRPIVGGPRAGLDFIRSIEGVKMVARRMLRVLTVSLSASLYVGIAPQSHVQPERGPMRARAVARPPRLDAIPPGTAR